MIRPGARAWGAPQSRDMHGIIFNQLRGYALERLGEKGWETLLRQAGLPLRVYLAFQSYPDEEAEALVLAASKLTGMPVRALLEDFGESIAPSMMKIYRASIHPGWTILDVVINVERIHERVRRDSNVAQPRLECRRIDASSVHVTYSSPRKLCGMGIGFARGLARELGQRVEVHEHQCMYKGAPHCEFLVKQVA
ncbi:MAG: heme NO-binding domain-containing protein [Myxococcaceae bacterium]|nr:heme NO-binding domain-containing protein [Myxococcaceae bacterium]